MIKKIHCKCIKNFQGYVLFPNTKITENELTKNCIHQSINFDIDYIFDLRKEIINSNINGKVYFYIAFKRDKDTYIDIHVDLKGTCLISDFNRNRKAKNITYEINKNNFEIDHKNKYIYLGSSDINFRETAYEIKNCFHNSISESGKGFYAFNLNIEYNIPSCYIDLIISDKPLFNNSIHISNFKDIYSTTEYPFKESIYIEPTAPPIENNDIEPTAPPIENNDIEPTVFTIENNY